MHEVFGKRGPHRRIAWFDVGASVLFVTIGVVMLTRGLWHTIVHHDLMLRSLIGGLLFCTIGTLFGIEGLRTTHSHQRKLRARISKRHRTVNL